MNEKVTELTNKALQQMHRAGFKIQKHSPEILLAAGIVGVVGTVVMACKATTKIEEAKSKSKDEQDMVAYAIEKLEDKEEFVLNEETGKMYTQDDLKRDLLIMKTHIALNVAELYIPAVTLGVVSITCLLASHNILRERNVALTAAYAGLEKAFKGYRERVTERFGEEVEKEIRYGIKAKKFEEIETDEEGKSKKVKKNVDVAADDPTQFSPYARFFQEGCSGWTKNAESNLNHLLCQQSYANEILKLKGHLFLNEVYDLLGIPRTKAGQCVGWVYDEENPIGDNFVDFGIFNTNLERTRDFVNGYENVILMDFNVDGNILDLI